jgi:NDP-sugar pyrophosphorylase family protein
MLIYGDDVSDINIVDLLKFHQDQKNKTLTIIQFEKLLLEIANDKQLADYKHLGFWKPVDTFRDRIEIEELWKNSEAKWQIWEKYCK